MRVHTILIGTTLLLACVTVAAPSFPTSAQPLRRPGPTQYGSVTGTISSIGDAEFSVQVKKNHDPIVIIFLIDDQTRIEGKLEVGSAATVDYRADGGNYIARHIVVRSAIRSN